MDENIPYDHYIDVDDNNYFIRKYSDENMPIYNKQLSVSQTNIETKYLISHRPINNTSLHVPCYRNTMCYICIVIIIELLIIIIIRIFYPN